MIFEADTATGRIFDGLLAALIFASVIAVILESVHSISVGFGPILRSLEWGFTILFTIEYIVRLAVVERPVRYAFSFFGIVDFLAAVPMYI